MRSRGVVDIPGNGITALMSSVSTKSKSQVAASNVVIHELPDSPKKIIEHGVKITEPQEGVLTQASRAPTLDPTVKGKRKLEVELSESDSDSDAGSRVQDVDVGLLAYEDGWDEEDEDDESRGDAKFTEGEDSEDDDYDPAKDDDDVAAYGVGDDFLFDWLTKVEVDEKNEKGGSSAVASRKTHTVEGPEVEDSEAMYEAEDSDEKKKGTKLPPKTKNELRAKTQLRKAATKDKRDEKRAAEKVVAKAAGKGPPTRGRPPKATTSIVRNSSANAQPSQASSRSTEENRG
ncbi:hypothetical protein ACLB2K_020183 [Fragaria x ananassa]